MDGMVDIFGNVDTDKPWREMLAKYEQIPLYSGEVPDYDESLGQRKPSITFFRSNAEQPRGCVVVMAGGSYTHKAVHEGEAVAQKLNEVGIHAAVLDYRVIPYAHSVIVSDAKRAVRYLRYHAEEFGILPDKIGVEGFSAGGNLAAVTCLLGDDGDPDAADPVERVSSRPDAAVLGYAAINFVSAEDFDDDDDEFNIMKYFEFVFEDGMQFPPAFIWQSMSDGLINYQTSLDLCRTLKQKLNTPVEMHLFPYGEHGQGLADKGEKADDLACVWGDLCNRWLLHYGF